jgi:hypothetical protein
MNGAKEILRRSYSSPVIPAEAGISLPLRRATKDK